MTVVGLTMDYQLIKIQTADRLETQRHSQRQIFKMFATGKPKIKNPKPELRIFCRQKWGNLV